MLIAISLIILAIFTIASIPFDFSPRTYERSDIETSDCREINVSEVEYDLGEWLDNYL